jgi:hypothetical protein
MTAIPTPADATKITAHSNYTWRRVEAMKLLTLQFFPISEGYIIIIIIMAVQPFVGPWPLFRFLDPIHSR